MNIALFIGSFNPPHLGHRAVAKDLIQSNPFEEVWIVPNFKHPFEKNLIPFEDRVRMCHLAFDSLGKKIKVSEAEKEVASPKGWTIDLVNYLLKKYSEDQFTLVLGSDLLQESNRWKDFEEIKKKVAIFPIVRAGDEKSKYPNISSSDVREAILKGKNIEALVPKSVMEYIQKKGLYSPSLLSPSRGEGQGEG